MTVGLHVQYKVGMAKGQYAMQETHWSAHKGKIETPIKLKEDKCYVYINLQYLLF